MRTKFEVENLLGRAKLGMPSITVFSIERQAWLLTWQLGRNTTIEMSIGLEDLEAELAMYAAMEPSEGNGA